MHFYVRCSRSVKAARSDAAGGRSAWFLIVVAEVDRVKTSQERRSTGTPWVWHSRTFRLGNSHASTGVARLAHRFARDLQLDAMTVMNEAIQDRIGKGGLSEVRVPGIDG